MLIKVNNMKELEDIFMIGLNSEYNSVAVEISLPNQPNNGEVIVTKKKNIRGKLNYYKKFYDDNLINNKNPGIKILAADYGNIDFWEDIKQD